MVARKRTDAQRLALDRRRSGAAGSLRLGLLVAREGDHDSAQPERSAAGLHRASVDAIGTARWCCARLHRTQSMEERQRQSSRYPPIAGATCIPPEAVSGPHVRNGAILLKL